MTAQFTVTLLLLAFVAFNSAVAFRQQMVGVRGRLLCGTKALNDTQVKLWSKNKLGTDDQLGAVKTDATGNFQVEGGVGGLLALNVHLKVYHDCNDGIKPCQRKVDLGIPNEYVTRSDKVIKWFETGTINMEFLFPDEERSCIN